MDCTVEPVIKEIAGCEISGIKKSKLIKVSSFHSWGAIGIQAENDT
jgi:hypothetical protein